MSTTGIALADDTVEIRLEGSPLANLERRDGVDSPWQQVCAAPCTSARVSSQGQYRVTGSGIRPSSPFRLSTANADPVTHAIRLDVDPAPTSSYMLGLGLIGTGAAMLLAGGILFAASSTSTSDPANGTTDDGHATRVGIGSILMLSGASAGIGGTALWLNNRASTVSGGVLSPGPQTGFVAPVFWGTF